MFKNIGAKIKALAKVIFGLEVAASVLIGLAIMMAEEGAAFIGFCLFWVVIPFLAWIGSLFLYGFGELVDRTTKIEERLNNLSKRPGVQTTQPNVMGQQAIPAGQVNTNNI